MKVAIILTGHMRCWESLFPTFKAQFIDRYTPDIFISTWSDEGWWRPHCEIGFNEQSPKLNLEKVNEHYNPKSIVVEEYNDVDVYFKNVSSVYKNYLHNPKNVVSMLYKMHTGGILLENYIARTGEYYDLVIRMRPDLTFNTDIFDLDSNVFYTLNHKNHLGQGTGDMFQAGPMKNVLDYTKLLIHLRKVYEASDTLCPHILSSAWVDMLKLNWHELNLSKKIWHSPFGEYIPSIGNSVLDLRTEENNKVY